MSQIEAIYHRHYTAVILPVECRILSSAVLNGGLTQCRSLLNLRVDKSAPPPWPEPADTLTQAAAELALPGPVCGMMTAASMKSLGEICLQQAGLEVRCWVTCGLSNLLRCGDPAGPAPRAGTINIQLYVSQPLTPAAMAEALILLTEAKVTAIRDAGLISPLSAQPASGTGTDSHAVLCPATGSLPPLSYCGKHTAAGELIGRAVLDACRYSIDRCLTAEREGLPG
ncbi:MAG: adenosylcobinamide amidohydrolase [Pseudomonadota bacterium]|nr:adenosylcobinamide amidohydrolase [Pseudomonadota bacterium]